MMQWRKTKKFQVGDIQVLMSDMKGKKNRTSWAGLLASMQLPSKHVAAETKTLLPNGPSFPFPGDGASPRVAETPGGFCQSISR